uniref:Uncharacterized protein n=1 Tax=Pithovirus LCPAC001 TaxID=2506585 RepID=A0A481Z3E3_9VIRU|nr:MAG: hypothetical protein LCPAC001_00580 [Pithovirus LCPAC001]
MIFLILDPGHSTGFCIIKVENKISTIIEYGFYDIDISSEYEGDWCLDFQKWVNSLIDKHKPIEIVRESYFFSGRFRNGSNVNVAYRTVIDMASRALKLKYHTISPSIWKKFICGRSTPTKQQKEKYGKLNAKKSMVQEALWIYYKIKFPNFCTSQKNKRTIKFRHDIVDAVAMAVYFSRIILKVNDIANNCIPPSDIVWKKKITTFDYDNIGKIYHCEHTFKSGKKNGLICNRVCYISNKCNTHTKKVKKKEVVVDF